MDPIGTTGFAVMIGLATIFSLYFVLSKLFKSEVGLIAAFLYATLLTTVNTDRWVVPTITTNLWVIWYLYSVLKISRGDYKVLPLLGVLIGLIWHIHIALIPVLIAIPAAIYFAKKIPNVKQIAQFLIALFITNLPLLIFELRHGFGQTFSLITNFAAPQAGPTGLYKLTLVLNMVVKNIGVLFFAPQSITQTFSIFFVLIIVFSGFLLIRKRLLSYKEFLILLTWIAGVIAFFGFSSSPISEYYFSNIGIIFLSLVSLLLYLTLKSSKLGRASVVGLLIFITIKNGHFIVTQDYYHKGYAEKKSVVDYIKKDAEVKGLPCIGVSYITAPGENVGFRYLFYLNKLHLVHPSIEVPVYNIVIPDELSSKEVKQKFGHIGIIPPTNIPAKEVIEKSCQTPDTNLTDSMFGYVD